MQRARTPPHLMTLILLTAFSTLSLNMFLPSLARIAEDLQADYAVVSLSVAGYLAVTALIQLGIGPLSDRVGRRPVLLGRLRCLRWPLSVAPWPRMSGVFWPFACFRAA